MSKRDSYTPVANNVYFDPDNCDAITSDNVQDAVDELCTQVSQSASPGFSWGRSGNVSSGTWLQNDNVSSNKAGRTVTFGSPQIVRIFVATEDLNTYTVEVYEHEGDSINLTLLTSLSVVASRTGDSGAISVPMTSGEQLAVKLSSGSAKNIVVGMILTGENT
jgi:hypothetical protein